MTRIAAASILATLAVLAAVAVPGTPAAAAAPAVSLARTTVLTTDGRTAVSYSGLMNGESFQQDGITTFGGWQYAAFWDQDGYVNLSRRQLPAGAWQNVRLTDY